MTFLVLATRANLHNEALAAADAVGADGAPPVGRLNAPALDDAKLWVTRLWDTAAGAIEAAWEDGRAAAAPLIERFGQEILELRETFAEGAKAVIDLVAERLAEYARTLTRRLMSQFEENLTIGVHRFEVRGITVQQKLKMTGTLKASLHELCSFVSEGEITVSAKYAV
ncbi:MAG: hypothetical protein JOY90_39500 [Bradyrhizobium sp.]|uniref:hypothetical protein n=1 Tax=Bradyrhizobium sp. TaxID=376 RepID=UPI001D7B6E04|nr:hypothetical protein [Bradyrhizobium sp.]MBV9566486.1 hypothetical protein [Bradyrhizobium sp.]